MTSDAKPKGGNTVTAVWKLAEPLAAELGLTLWDVRYLKEGATWYLRIIIDKPDGIAISDCEDMSHAIDAPLDEADLIEHSYHLQVSSPGLERDLRLDAHFAHCLGQKIQLRLIRPLNNVRDYAGELAAFEAGIVTLTLPDGSQMQVNQKETSFIRLDDFGGIEN